MGRIVSWFSCGAASAVATKLMLSEDVPVTIAYCRVREEHEDNMRFLKDCEKWFGQKILILENETYKGSCVAVFNKNYFRTPKGSPCTRELKRKVRLKFQQDSDTIVFGYTAEEEDRLNDFIDRNNAVPVRAPLVEQGLTKENVLAMVERAGIDLPEMYKLGYEHNNCIGCVKGGMGYWNKIRVDFPEQFKMYADMEREKGYTILKESERDPNTGNVIKDPITGKIKQVPLYLHDLDSDRGRFADEPKIQCGILCESAEAQYVA